MPCRAGKKRTRFGISRGVARRAAIGGTQPGVAQPLGRVCVNSEMLAKYLHDAASHTITQKLTAGAARVGGCATPLLSSTAAPRCVACIELGSRRNRNRESNKTSCRRKGQPQHATTTSSSAS